MTGPEGAGSLQPRMHMLQSDAFHSQIKGRKSPGTPGLRSAGPLGFIGVPSREEPTSSCSQLSNKRPKPWLRGPWKSRCSPWDRTALQPVPAAGCPRSYPECHVSLGTPVTLDRLGGGGGGGQRNGRAQAHPAEGSSPPAAPPAVTLRASVSAPQGGQPSGGRAGAGRG